MASAPLLAAPAAPQFSDGFLIGGKAIDMQHYARAGQLEAGVHPLDLIVNGEVRGTQDIVFTSDEDSVQPCISVALVRTLGLKARYMDALDPDPEACVALAAMIDGASVEADGAALQLLIGIPQAAQASVARGYVAPSQRDPGVTAGFIDYAFNQSRSEGGRDSRYLGMNAGINVGAWRLRHRASISHSERGTRHEVISSHVQRDLPQWNSQLLLGQGNTGGELFDSVAFTGVRVATDERMLPDSLRGYAPVVRGIAEGNAMVRIRQNGNIIHEANVAPGPFSIEDLYPTNFGGDLDVTVTEADGREQRFSVSFSAVPQALRAGSSRFSATAGALRDASGYLRDLRFAEGTYARGISNRLTALGGAQLGEDYQAVLAGAAINTAIGAFGADVTHSRARLRGDERISGNSYRLNYQRYVASTGTNVGLAAYRYSTRGYLTLGDVARLQDDDWGHGSRARQRYQLNFSQKVGARSSLYVSGGHVSYWDSTQRRNDVQLGFQSVWGRANYGISAMRYRLQGGSEDTRYAFTLSVPLGRSPSAPRLGSQFSHAGNGRQAQLGLNGTLGESRALSYNVSAGEASGGDRNGSAYVAYQGGRGNFSAGYSRSGSHSALSASAAGSVVVHGGGVNIGAPVGEGFVLVQADGAQGAKVGYGAPIRVGGNGYALLPHVSPYRWNQIDLDPSGLPLEVELLQTSQRVAPTAGSIVRVVFTARRERTLFIDTTDALGQPLPFAARVDDEAGRTLGAVGQGGVIQVRGAQDSGALWVDPDGPHRCRLEYRVPDAPDAYGLSWTQAVCVPQPVLRPGLQAAADAAARAE
ncbi:fimbria/pilus outer membrane usher protein [Stenotrophomonas indicatrix]|uniref:fimbria/pilus outer membrane usher protein n=1 Tax=Stenotrophomonas indicatrix TaxID=2045451 RepID=UPI0028A6A616|nr:fimbria/pilus outer membrane usher protein [Stenotrophomonas indicatrix]